MELQLSDPLPIESVEASRSGPQPQWEHRVEVSGPFRLRVTGRSLTRDLPSEGPLPCESDSWGKRNLREVGASPFADEKAALWGRGSSGRLDRTDP